MEPTDLPFDRLGLHFVSPPLTHPSPASTQGELSLSTLTTSDSLGLGLNLDLSLPTALSALVHHLTQPLAAHYPHATLLELRRRLTTLLTPAFTPTWREKEPLFGTGTRSLICTNAAGLPRALKCAAKEIQVDEKLWKRALGKRSFTASPGEVDETEEWEAWCDPGMVMWRYGPWEYDDGQFDPIKRPRQSVYTVWQALPAASPEPSAPNLTPSRPHAIPIRAPAVYAIPPTPASNTDSPTVPSARPVSPSLLPPAFIAHETSSSLQRPHSRQSSAEFSLRSPSPTNSDFSDALLARGAVPKNHARENGDVKARANHRGTGSTSSVASSASDSNSNQTQLLTPASRPGSADPFLVPLPKDNRDDKTPTPAVRGRDPSPTTPRDATPSSATATPTVTPYDNGNVTVLGGGVKLGGGGSRPASVMSGHRTPIDRSRSPSISLASRALNTALSPNGTAPGSPRKPRTRRRIMPTYLGHLGQAGPIMGAFGQFTPQPIQQQQQPAYPWGGVGVGMGPPPAVIRPVGTRMGS